MDIKIEQIGVVNNSVKHKKEKHLQRRPQNREDMPLVGIFSQREKIDQII